MPFYLRPPQTGHKNSSEEIDMKRMILTFAAGCIALTTLQAQSFINTAEIPFAFHAGKTTLPAGHYRFSQSRGNQFQMIQNQQTYESIMLMAGTPGVGAAKHSRLIFHRYGQQYFLSEVHSGNGNDTRLPITSAEREAREQAAPDQEASVSVLPAARR
jgi:hypothetical protein